MLWLLLTISNFFRKRFPIWLSNTVCMLVSLAPLIYLFACVCLSAFVRACVLALRMHVLVCCFCFFPSYDYSSSFRWLWLGHWAYTYLVLSNLERLQTTVRNSNTFDSFVSTKCRTLNWSIQWHLLKIKRNFYAHFFVVLLVADSISHLPAKTDKT